MSKPQRIARVHARPSGSRAVAFGSPDVRGSGAPAIGTFARPVALLAVAVAMLLALLAAPAAQAHQSHAVQATYDFGGAFGTAGPGAMAIHQATHTLYVVDSTNNRILKFDISNPDSPTPQSFSATGSNEITEADGAPLVLAAGSNIAVDNSGGPQDGTIYLATNTGATSRAEAFSASGAWIYQFGHNAAGRFDAGGTPDLGGAIAVAQKGPRAGEIYRFGSSRNDSAAYTPSAVAGGLPTLRATGGPTSSFGTPLGAFYWSDGSELVLAVSFFGGPSLTPMNSETLLDQGSIAKYPLANGSSDFTAAGVYRHLFVRGKSAISLVEETGVGNINTAPPNILDEFAFGSPGTGTGTGMVYEAATDRLYVSDGAGGTIDIYGPATAPDAEMLETGYVDPTTAMLRAAVEPHGLTITECRFEWSTSSFFWTNKEDCAVMPSGNGKVEVAIEVPVTPPTKYHSRIVVVAANGTGRLTPDFEWQAPNLPEGATLPAGPQARTGTAVLGGTVDANQTPAHFHIEYSTHADLSGAQSSAEADAGEGDSPTRVSQVVEGLKPDTTYYFRLVAVTKAGSDQGEIKSFHTFEAPAGPEPTTCPNEQFRTGPSAKLPECRAWERVSPADKNGQSVMQGFTVASTDGNRVTYGSLGAFAGQEERGFGVAASYLADRGPNGWESQGISPATTVPISEPAYVLGYYWMTPSLSRLMGIGLNVRLPGLPADNTAAYVWDSASQQIRMITGGAGKGLDGQLIYEEPVGGNISDSGDSGVLVARGPLPVESGPDAKSGEFGAYWWEEDGGVRLASVLPGGEPAENGAGTYSNLVPLSSRIGMTAMSRDGDKVIWVARSAPGNPSSPGIYVSQRRGPTLWASQAQGVPEPASTALAVTAWTPDLHYVYFTANKVLTEGATAPGGGVRDLYRFDTDSGELVDLTTSDPAGGAVESVLNLAADGSRVYFVARGNLAAGATGAEPKLYVWSEGDGIRFITQYKSTAAGANTSFTGKGYERGTRIADNGRYLLFTFGGSVAGTRMDSVYDTGGHQMIYRYDWAQDRVDCVSCDPRGRPATSDAYLTMPVQFRGTSGVNGPQNERYFMSDTGRVMFTTAQSLSPEDVNATFDTYLWDDGETRLLTTGHSEYGEWAETATKDFTNVFLLSGRQLVSADEDHNVDLYDARVDGGLASQQARKAPPSGGCEGPGCQGLGTPPPAAARLDTERSAGEAAAAPEGEKCAKRRATAKRRGKAVRRHRAAVRRTHRAVRKAKRRYKAAPSARLHRQVVKQQRRLRRARAKVKTLRRHERRAKAALRRCQGGASVKDTAQTRRRSGHRHALDILRRHEGGRS